MKKITVSDGVYLSWYRGHDTESPDVGDPAYVHGDGLLRYYPEPAYGWSDWSRSVGVRVGDQPMPSEVEMPDRWWAL